MADVILTQDEAWAVKRALLDEGARPDLVKMLGTRIAKARRATEREKAALDVQAVLEDRLSRRQELDDEPFTYDSDNATLKVTCNGCGEAFYGPNKGLVRANLAAWKTRHQHIEETS